jgi:hypothetical protein
MVLVDGVKRLDFKRRLFPATFKISSTTTTTTFTKKELFAYFEGDNTDALAETSQNLIVPSSEADARTAFE